MTVRPQGVAAPFAVAARLAHGTGAALAAVLDACAVAAREKAEADLARETALAGPRLSARVLAWLPVVGVGLAVLVDASVLRVFVTPAWDGSARDRWAAHRDRPLVDAAARRPRA